MSRMVRRALVGVLVLFASCSEGGVATQSAEPSASVEKLSAGADAYRHFCAECHGEDLRGTDQGPSFLSVVYEPNHHADAAFLLAAQRGVPQHHWNFGDMPPVEGIEPEQIEAITAHVRQVQSELGFID